MKRQFKINPKKQIATWEQVRIRRDELEQYPLTVASGHKFDVNLVSFKRFEEALNFFDELPTLVDGKIAWKTADNIYVEYTKQELTDLSIELKRQLAKRGSILHVNAEIIFGSQKTVEEIEDLNLWGVEDF